MLPRLCVCHASSAILAAGDRDRLTPEALGQSQKIGDAVTLATCCASFWGPAQAEEVQYFAGLYPRAATSSNPTGPGRPTSSPSSASAIASSSHPRIPLRRHLVLRRGVVVDRLDAG